MLNVKSQVESMYSQTSRELGDTPNVILIETYGFNKI